MRDGVLGLRLVNGLAETIRCGGRVMKNVTGLDLTKLNCGAHGTLGVLTEATIKLAPKPEAEATLVIPELGDLKAIEAMTRALGSPFGVSGAAWLAPGMGREFSRTLLRLEGFADSVDYRAGRLASLIGEFGEVAALTERNPLRCGARFATPRSSPSRATGPIWRVSVAPSRAAPFVAGLGETALAHGL